MLSKAESNGHGEYSRGITPEELAQRLNLKAQTANGETEWHGANPFEAGATADGFFLNSDGSAYDRKNARRYTSREIETLAGLGHNEYEPNREYSQRNGTQQNGHRAPKIATPKPKAPAKPFDWKRATIHEYRDESGALLFQVARTGSGDEKQISQRRPDGTGGWIYKLENARRVLYRLPDVLKAHSVLICEGEQAADAVNAALEVAGYFGEYIATTAPHGAGKFRDEYTDALREKTLYVLPDNDPQGAAGAEQTLQVLARNGITARRVELPELPPKGDAADFLAAGGDASSLLSFCEMAPIWKPETDEPEAASTRAPRFPRIGLAQVFARPRLEYLIQDFLLERGTGVLSADYGAYKSFLAASMGFCVADGMDWHGRKTKRGTVVYIVAEGAYTIADRAKAFFIRHQIEAPENFHIIETPVQIGDEAQCNALIEELAEIEPAFIIFDTLAKCNLGRDENDTTAMTLFTHGMDRIASELGAFVLAIHHNNKNGTTRGAVALPANVDTHIILKPKGQRIVTVECDKQKGAPFEPFSLVGRIVELPETDEYGRAVTSLVFDSTDAPATPPSKADESLEKVFRVLAAHPEGLRAGEWIEKSGLSSSRFYEMRDALRDDGRIQQDGRIYRAVLLSPISPISPIRTNRSGFTFSDFSDDVLTSEESEKTGEYKTSNPNRRKSNANAESEHYRTQITTPDPFDDVEEMEATT